MTVRLGAFLRLAYVDRETAFLRQYGVSEVIVSGKADSAQVAERLPQERSRSLGFGFTAIDYSRWRESIEAGGLRLFAIENPMVAWGYDHIQVNGPARDVQVENYAQTVRELASAGIHTFGIHWMLNPVGQTQGSYRTGHAASGRGGAQVSSFDSALLPPDLAFRDDEVSADDLRKNFVSFASELAPVLKETGVRMAIHPDDPPLGSLGGIPRVFSTADDYRMLLDEVGSPHVGINLCLGNWTAMGNNLQSVLREFGQQGRIFYSHAQGVQGAVPRFSECFLDEGDCDYRRVFEELSDVGFDGVIAPAHLPVTDGDGVEQYQANAFALGYLRGLLESVYPRATGWPIGGRLRSGGDDA